MSIKWKRMYGITMKEAKKRVKTRFTRLPRPGRMLPVPDTEQYHRCSNPEGRHHPIYKSVCWMTNYSGGYELRRISSAVQHSEVPTDAVWGDPYRSEM